MARSHASGGGASVEERYLDHLAEAIRFRTVGDADGGDPSAFGALRRWIATTYPELWRHGHPEVVGDHSLLFTVPGTDPTLSPILLLGHLDVVPVPDDGGAWTWPPFAGERTDTHLHGRGAIDDKGSVVAILEAVEELLSTGVPLRRTLHLAFGHDEESTGRQGAGAIARLLRQRDIHLALVLDEGGFVTEGVVRATRRPVALVGVAEKGYLDVELVATGDAGHSGRPPASPVITRLARALAAVGDAPMPARPRVQTAFFRAVSRAVPLWLRPAVRLLPRLGGVAVRLLSRDPATAALIRTTIAPTVVNAGSRPNVMPAIARAILNVRILPGDSTASVLEHIRAAVGDLVTARPVDGFEPSPVSPPDGPGFHAVAATIRALHPDAVVAPWVVIGATDSRYFTRLADEVLRFTPFRVDSAELAGFHGPDERIRLSDAGPAVAFYSLLVERLCR